jgi:hypothetical protein
MRILLVLIVVVCIVLFFAGVFAPERSKRMQRWVADKLRKGERKGDENAGKLGDMTTAMLEKSRQATDNSAESGRAVHDKAADAGSAVKDTASGATAAVRERAPD